MWNSIQLLSALLACGVLGTVGQGIRAVLGLKNATVQPAGPGAAPPAPAATSGFDGRYLLVTLMLGFIAGALAGLLVGLDKFNAAALTNSNLLLSIVAAGYAGSDFIENALGKLMPGRA